MKRTYISGPMTGLPDAMTHVGIARQEHGRAPGLDVPHPRCEGACAAQAAGTGEDMADAARGNAQAVEAQRAKPILRRRWGIWGCMADWWRTGIAGYGYTAEDAYEDWKQQGGLTA